MDSAAQQRHRKGTTCLVVGVVGALLSIVGFASAGYVGSRAEVFGGWIVLLFLTTVGSLVLGGYGMMQRRRAVRERTDVN